MKRTRQKSSSERGSNVRHLRIAGLVAAVCVVLGVLWVARFAGGSAPRSTVAHESAQASDSPRPRATRSSAWLGAVESARSPRGLHGTIRSRARQAISGAQVCATARRPDGAPGLASIDVRCAAASADGTYQLSLDPGRYRLVATAHGHQPSDTASRQLELAADTPAQQLDFELDPGGARVSGVVHDLEGGPIANARVQAVDPRGDLLGSSVAHTDDSGGFELSLTPGAVLLEVAADGYARAQHETTVPSAGVEIELIAAARIVGEVVERHSGRPIAGVRVNARTGGSLEGVAVATSADDGSFALEGLSPGEYELSARAVGWYGRSSAPLTLAIGQTGSTRLVLDSAAAVGGRVLVGAGDRACPEAQLFLTAAGFEASALTDGEGRYRLEGVPPGTFLLQAICSLAQRTPASRQISVGSEDLVDVELRVEQGGSLRGRVVDARGQPVAGRNVLVVPVGTLETGGGAARTDAHGEFEVSGLVPGEYRAQLEHAPLVSQTVRVVHEGRGAEILLRTPASGALHVVLHGAHDADPGQGWVVYARGEQTVRHAENRGGGSFSVADLAPGTYEVTAHHPQSGTVSSTCDVRAELTVTVNLRAPERRASLEGVVLDQHGAPAPEVRVSAIVSEGVPHAGNAPRFTLSAADGTFRIEGLSERMRYELEASSALEGSGKLSQVTPGQHVTLKLSKTNP